MVHLLAISFCPSGLSVFCRGIILGCTVGITIGLYRVI